MEPGENIVTDSGDVNQDNLTLYTIKRCTTIEKTQLTRREVKSIITDLGASIESLQEDLAGWKDILEQINALSLRS